MSNSYFFKIDNIVSVNQRVLGSSPRGGANLVKGLTEM